MNRVPPSEPHTGHQPDFVPTRADYREVWKTTPWRRRPSKLFELTLHTRLFRAFARFSEANGSLLAAGISYRALFSLTAAISLSGVVFSTVLNSNAALQNAVIEAVNSWLPGLIRSSAEPEGLVSPDALQAGAGATVAGAVSLVILLFTASSVVASISMSIRAMFGLSTVRERLTVVLAQRFLGLFALLLGIASTALLIFVTNWLQRHVRMEYWMATGSTWAASFIINTVLVAVVIRWVAGIQPVRSDLLWGSTISGFATSLLQLLGTSVLQTVKGPILTAATTLITLILWVNLQARIVLLASAWTANPPRIQTRVTREARKEGVRPNYATLSDPSSLDADSDPASAGWGHTSS